MGSYQRGAEEIVFFGRKDLFFVVGEKMTWVIRCSFHHYRQLIINGSGPSLEREFNPRYEEIVPVYYISFSQVD